MPSRVWFAFFLPCSRADAVTIVCPPDDRVPTFADIDDNYGMGFASVSDVVVSYADGDPYGYGYAYCDPASTGDLDESLYGEGSSLDVTCSVFAPEAVPISDTANPFCSFTVSIGAPRCRPGTLAPRMFGNRPGTPP